MPDWPRIILILYELIRGRADIPNKYVIPVLIIVKLAEVAKRLWEVEEGCLAKSQVGSFPKEVLHPKGQSSLSVSAF